MRAGLLLLFLAGIALILAGYIGEKVRVIAPGAAFPDLAEGQEVRFSIREFLVYEDDGSLEEMLQIRS